MAAEVKKGNSAMRTHAKNGNVSAPPPRQWPPQNSQQRHRMNFKVDFSRVFRLLPCLESNPTHNPSEDPVAIQTRRLCWRTSKSDSKILRATVVPESPKTRDSFQWQLACYDFIRDDQLRKSYVLASQCRRILFVIYRVSFPLSTFSSFC